MGNRTGLTLRLCLLAGCLSLLMLSGTALAASIDTTKIQTNVVNVPATTVKAPVQVKPQQPNVIVPPSGPQRAAPAQSVQPKVKAGIVGPAMGPGSTGIVGPAMGPGSTGIVGPAMGPGSTGIVGPAMAPGRIQPQYGPKPTFNYPLQPDVNRSMPDANNSSGIYVPATPPPAVNTLGGPKMNEQALDRIQNIQEAATAAEVFDQIKQMKDFEDTMAIGAGSSGRPGGQAGALGDAGDHLGVDKGASAHEIYGNLPGNRRGDTEGNFSRDSADPASNWNRSSSAGPPLGTNKDKGGFTGRQFSRNTNGGIDFKGSYSHDNGSRSTVIITTADDGAGNVRQTTSVVTNDANGDIIAQRDTVQVRGSDGESRTISDTSTGDTSRSSDSAEAFRAGAASVNRSTGNTEETGEKKVNPASQPNDNAWKGGGCDKDPMTGKCRVKQMTREEKKDRLTSPTKGDADTGEGSSTPSVGTAAVTDEDQFHSRGGIGEGLSEEEIWGRVTGGSGGGTPPPPPPSGSSLDDAMGAESLR